MPFTFVCKFDHTPLSCKDQALGHFSECHPTLSHEREVYLNYILNAFDFFLFPSSFISSVNLPMTNSTNLSIGTISEPSPSNGGSGSAPALLSKTFFCPDCNKPFHTEAVLTSHAFKIHGIVRKKSQDPISEQSPSHCDICQKPFKNAKGVNRHKMLIHGDATDQDTTAQPPGPDPVNEKDNFCEACNRPFDSFRAFNLHNFYKHPDIHQQLQKSSVTASHLQSSCSLCGKSFKTPGGLKTHQGYKHPDSQLLDTAPETLQFRFHNSNLQVKKQFIDEDLSDQPIEIWIDIPHTSGNYHGMDYSIVNGVFEFKVTVPKPISQS